MTGKLIMLGRIFAAKLKNFQFTILHNKSIHKCSVEQIRACVAIRYMHALF